MKTDWKNFLGWPPLPNYQNSFLGLSPSYLGVNPRVHRCRYFF